MTYLCTAMISEVSILGVSKKGSTTEQKPFVQFLKLLLFQIGMTYT